MVPVSSPTASRRSRLLWMCLAVSITLRPAQASAQLAEKLIGPDPPVPPAVIVRDEAGLATVRASRLDGEFVLDGALTEAIYTSVLPYADFVQQEPQEGQPATEKTEVWLFFDDANVYVGARLHESDPSRRVMSEMRRDSFNMFNNDHIAVLFDTFYDRRNGFGFSANRLGGLFDWTATNEQPSPNWNGLWTSAAQDFDGGWTIEMRIPFRSIRFKEGSDVWGVNFRRMVRWKNEISVLERGAAVVGASRLEQAVECGDGRRPPDSVQEPQHRPQALRPRFSAHQPDGDPALRERPRRQLRRRRQVGHHTATGCRLHLQHRLRPGRR